MKKSTRAAVRAGSSFARMERFRNEPIDAAIPVAATAPPMLRRILRRLVRMARPLGAPLLHRLQTRIRSAVDSSEVTAALARIEGRTAEQLARIAALAEEVMADTQRLERVELQLEALQRRLQEGQGRLETGQGRLEAGQGRLETGQGKLDQLTAQVALAETAASATISKLDALLQRQFVPFQGAIAIRTDNGYLLAPLEDKSLVLALLETHGTLEAGTSAVLQTLAPEGGTVIDVGANVGTLTLPAARRVGPAGQVIAIEAAPRMADLLSTTVRMNGLDWVAVHAVAAGDKDGAQRLNLSAQTTHNSMFELEDTTETIDIQSVRLDSLVAPGGRVDLVKIDVEGAELAVWLGMQRVVADNPDIAVVLEFGPSHLRKAGQSIAGWFETLQSTGLKAWEIDEASGMVRPLRMKGLAAVFSINILLMRDSPSTRGLKVR